jgi:hypothetical protein
MLNTIKQMFGMETEEVEFKTGKEPTKDFTNNKKKRDDQFSISFNDNTKRPREEVKVE